MNSSAKDFFSAEDQFLITEAIRNAELDTSGEIRVHVENSCPGDVLDRAAYLFRQLNMHRTKLRNGVLFYLAIQDRKFAILGDIGINQVVPSDFWDTVKSTIFSAFSEGKFREGLTEGIRLAGSHLKKHFPYQKQDVNELTNDISFGNR